MVTSVIVVDEEVFNKCCICFDCSRERNCLLKEAEVLHKARFNYIIQIFGVCNEPEFFCIVTEYMINGSLDQLLHEVTPFKSSLCQEQHCL